MAEVVLCVPPGPDGRVFPPTLAAAALAGVDEVYRIGGAQAIAAMAYGTDSVRPVDVIVGPGNVYVALAKREVAAEGLVGVPAAFAGPSEVVVVADETTPAEWAAVDVIVQAEHGPDGLAWLVTWSEPVADAVTAAVARIVAASPRRADIEATLDGGGYAVVVDGPEQALEVANAIAPEHLELMCAGAESLLPLGPPRRRRVLRAVGAGVGGRLPGRPQPRAAHLRVGPLRRRAPGRRLLRHDPRHLPRRGRPCRRSAPAVATLAEAEGLAAHAESVRMRMRTGGCP